MELLIFPKTSPILVQKSEIIFARVLEIKVKNKMMEEA
jgi:hypothetical protein